MAAEDVLLNDCSYWQFLKDFVHPIEEGVAIVDVFLELGCAFVTKAHAAIDLPVLVGSSQQDEVLRIFDLESEEEEDCFYAFGAAVYVVSQEEVVGVLDVAVRRLVTRRTKSIEESV